LYCDQQYPPELPASGIPRAVHPIPQKENMALGTCTLRRRLRALHPFVPVPGGTPVVKESMNRQHHHGP
jgi:hypothetical protein